MLSCPPATITDASPHLMAWTAMATDRSPDPHSMLITAEGTSLGIPAFIDACRAGFIPVPEENKVYGTHS